MPLSILALVFIDLEGLLRDRVFCFLIVSVTVLSCSPTIATLLILEFFWYN